MNPNVLIDSVALLVTVSVWLAMRKNALKIAYRRLLGALLLTITLIFLADMPAWLLDGRRFYGARALLPGINTAYYIFQIAYCYLWLLFVDCWSFQDAARLKKRAPLYALPMAAELLLILINIKTGWIFFLDVNNIYRRGQYYLLNLIPYYAYIIAAVGMAVRGGCVSGWRSGSAALLTFMLLPVCGALIESVSYGIAWLWPFAALSLLMVYLYAQQQALAEERLRSARREQDARVAVMLSQIQPHFLYNSLASIRELCRIDPALAERSVIDFAQFLRGNISSLSAEKPIPFEQELLHTQNYLALEQLRFGERLNVEYELNATLFRLPTLTLQPIVENAVRHGVAKNPDGGTLKIATSELPDSFTVTVTDGGGGFDPAIAPGGGHIGISNVRERLKSVCGGELEITALPGAGTAVTLIIPKEARTC